MPTRLTTTTTTTTTTLHEGVQCTDVFGRAVIRASLALALASAGVLLRSNALISHDVHHAGYSHHSCIQNASWVL